MANINRKMEDLGNVRSAIRDLFEYGNSRAAIIGRDNVYDFSLGNPSVEPPESFGLQLKEQLETCDSVKLHGYTSAPGNPATRQAIADDLNRRFNAGIQASDLYMTCGAAASLTISLKALVSGSKDEVAVLAPYFPEYRVFTEMTGATLREVKPDADFRIDFDSLKETVNENTKALIVNSPNNPTGVVLPPEVIKRLCDILREKEKEYGHEIFLISDEPYRELVYDSKTVVPYLINEYENTLVCYSYSKSLSIPGERIGYIIVSNRMKCHDEVYAAVCGAGRALGFVCAPSLMQRVVQKCTGEVSNLEFYRRNRDLLYKELTGLGFQCIHPDGAFYLFVKAPGGDAKAVSELAKKFELLVVPSDSFGWKGYIRLAYCVSESMIIRSLPAFSKLMNECRKNGLA